MRRWAFLFSLLAALSGTPLRQAEAANDLARTLAEFSHAADIEAPDGGVGDDSGVMTLSASHASSGETTACVDLFFLPPLSTCIATTPAAAEGLSERVWWPQSPPSSRFAWLQVFRF